LLFTLKNILESLRKLLLARRSSLN